VERFYQIKPESEEFKVQPIHSMTPKFGKMAILPTLLAGLFLPARAEVEREPIKFGTNIDAGQIIKGELFEGDEQTGQFLYRNGVYLTQSATVNKKLEISVGVGGLFWYTLPVSPGAPHTRLVKFGPGVVEASGEFKFGDPESPWGRLEFGYFPYKYNPDAKNLGEYEFRSGTYPGYLWTGGWSIINSAAYMAQGAKLTVPTFGGVLNHDFTLFMDRDFEPTYDISPSYLVTFKPNDGLEFGAGVTWAHGLPIKPSATTPKVRANAYHGDSALPLTEWDKPGYDLNDPHVVPDGDPRGDGSTAYTDGKPYVTVSDNGIPNSQLSYYTFQGIKVMGRAAINPQAWLQSELLGPQDLKLYGEFAILGVKNYPFYYEKIGERIPVMVGFNVPTFKLFDIFSVEVEYYGSKFQNNIREVFQNTFPKWKLPPNQTESTYPAFADSAKLISEDNLHWSVYAKRNLYEGLDLFLQVASDHMRVMDFNASPSDLDVTRKPSQWYYLARLQMGF
jgi:hypothetical protein